MNRFLVLLLAFSASAAYGEMYTWNDARGTVFYTNSLHEIPARYLRRARVLDVATGKKGGLAAQQPAPVPGQSPAQQAAPVNPAPPAPHVPTAAVANPLPPAAPYANLPQEQPGTMRAK